MAYVEPRLPRLSGVPARDGPFAHHLPSMGPIIHPNPLPLPVFCQYCYAQYNPSLYGPLCPNCGINAVPLPFSTASSPSFPANKVDENRSFNMMSDMFSSLDDVSINKDSGNVSGIHRPCYNCGMHPPMTLLYCIDCQEYVCQNCSNSHKPGHQIVYSSRVPARPSPISPPMPSSRTTYSPSISENEYCKEHSSEMLQYFCCDSVLCYSCIIEGHQHHQHNSIKEIYTQIEPMLDNLISKVNHEVSLLDLSAESTERMRDSVSKKREEAINTVCQIFQSHREAVNKREKEIIAQISAIADLRLDSLAKERDGIENRLEEIKELLKKMKESREKSHKASTISIHQKISHILGILAKTTELGQYPVEDDTFILKSNLSSVASSLKSLCILTTSSYPPLCTAVGEGLHHPRVNRLSTVIVYTKDRAGEACISGGERLLVSFKPIEGLALPVDVRDNQDGSYSINFRPQVRGEHTLTIAIRGLHIQGSPFKLSVDGGREYGRFGTVSKVFGSEGSEHGEFCRPWGICCDQKGNIIVGDRSNHRIQVFDIDGVFQHSFGSEGSQPGQFNRPAGVAVTRDGHVVVADKDNHRIQVLTIDGTFLFSFGSKGSSDGQMVYPYDVAVNQVDGRIAVTDTGNHRLLIFSSEGVLLGKFGYKGYLCGHFDSPRGIAFNDDGHIVVSDFNVHHILVIHPDGTTARILGSQGSGNGQFTRPQGIAIDHMGHFVIADTRNHRIVVMHPNGHFIAKLGSPGTGKGNLDRPTSVCVLPDGRVGVVDFGNSRVQIF